MKRIIESVCIMTLPGNDAYGQNGWCFTSAHETGGIDGAVPITMYIGGLYENIDQIVAANNRIWGQLYFNPVAALEPGYAAEYADDMKVWTNPLQT